MNVKRTTEYQYMPFIVKELEDHVGGVSIALEDLRKDVDSVPPGAYVGVDEDGLGHILKCVPLVDDVTESGKALKVKKSHQFVVGDAVSSKDKTGVKAYKIASIDTSNDDYDVLNVGTTLGVALDAGDYILLVDDVDSTGGASELPYELLGVTKREIDTTGSHAMAGVLTKGHVNVPNMAFGAPKYFREKLIHITYEGEVELPDLS